MKRLSQTMSLILIPVLVMLNACGGGGDDGIILQQPTAAVITLATTENGTMPAHTIITGYDVTITLPAGVTVKSTTAPPQTDDGVVTATGAAAGSSIITAVYSAATNTLSGTVRIWIANANSVGLSTGEFSTVNCDIAAGYYPATSDFPLPTFVANGNVTNLDSTDSTIDLTSYLALMATAVIR